MYLLLFRCPGGGIGRRSRLKICFLREYGFDPRPGYHLFISASPLQKASNCSKNFIFPQLLFLFAAVLQSKNGDTHFALGCRRTAPAHRPGWKYRFGCCPFMAVLQRAGDTLRYYSGQRLYFRAEITISKISAASSILPVPSAPQATRPVAGPANSTPRSFNVLTFSMQAA